jgi:uncharacterized membrane protein
MTEDLTAQPSVAVDAEEDGVVAAVISDGAHTLFLADFDDTEGAWTAYQALKSAQDGVTVKIEGVVVVKREEDGKVHILQATDHSTKKGLKWGVIGGAALGLIFPPSILAGAAVMGTIGAASGKARQLHQRGKLADDLESAILPGHSGIIALVSDPGAVKIRAALDAANMIVQTTVDDVVAREIKAAAKAAKKEAKA